MELQGNTHSIYLRSSEGACRTTQRSARALVPAQENEHLLLAACKPVFSVQDQLPRTGNRQAGVPRFTITPRGNERPRLRTMKLTTFGMDPLRSRRLSPQSDDCVLMLSISFSLWGTQRLLSISRCATVGGLLSRLGIDSRVDDDTGRPLQPTPSQP